MNLCGDQHSPFKLRNFGPTVGKCRDPTGMLFALVHSAHRFAFCMSVLLCSICV
jgi:hypothetical protein